VSDEAAHLEDLRLRASARGAVQVEEAIQCVGVILFALGLDMSDVPLDEAEVAVRLDFFARNESYSLRARELAADLRNAGICGPEWTAPDG
jgi:hypothetical protein